MNINSFIDIRPFTSQDSYSAQLQSDHCEVALSTSLGPVYSWNISNPEYHKFFAKDESQIFAQTTLANTDIKVLNAKIENQLETIADRLLSGNVGIQVIAEGFETFYEKLAQKLVEGRFHLLAEKPAGWNERKNITGIIVDTSKFSVRASACVSVDYQEDGRDATLRAPYVHVQELVSKQEMIIVGVHVPGTASQYPQNGLSELAAVVDHLWEEGQGNVPVIALGDFNSHALNVSKHFTSVLQPSYLTHAIPRFAAATQYDLAVVREAKEKSLECEMLPLAAVSNSSQALAKGLETLRT